MSAATDNPDVAAGLRGRNFLTFEDYSAAEIRYLIDLSAELKAPPAVVGFRSSKHAQAASLVPQAEVVVEPTLVTDVLPDGHDVLACGPEPMLEAIAAIAPGAQLA